MKTIFYYYNSTGTLFLSYSDGNGGYADEAYVFYASDTEIPPRIRITAQAYTRHQTLLRRTTQNG